MKRFYFLTIGIFLSLQASAGPSTSGGGYAVVCRDPLGKIQSAELLDLYEARTVLGFKLMPSTGTIEGDYSESGRNAYRLQAVSYFAPEYGEEQYTSAVNVTNFLKTAQFTKSGEKLPSVGDFGVSPLLANGCALEQLAIFYDADWKIQVQTDIWNALDSRGQAALIDHEYHYRYLRSEYGDKTSELVRLWVAHLFADASSVASVIDGLPAQGYKRCKTVDSLPEKTEFFLLGPSSSFNLTLQFSRLNSMSLPIKTTAELTVPSTGLQGQLALVKSSFQKGWTVSVTELANDQYQINLYEKNQLLLSDTVACVAK